MAPFSRADSPLFFFGRKSITALLNAFGLRVVDFGYEGYYRSTKQMAYGLLVVNNPDKSQQRLYDLEETGLLNWDLYLNLYDIMYVVGQKPKA